jgi:hypothetical protein
MIRPASAPPAELPAAAAVLAMPWVRRSLFWVAILMVVLQALGPFLHAHATAQPVNGGLHRHLGMAGFGAPLSQAGHGQALLAPESSGDDGSAVYLTTGFKRDLELLSPIDLIMVVVIVAAIACSLPQTRHRWQPGPVVGGRARRHWRPLAMAPPRT